LLSATATAARRYVDAIAGTGCTIIDTRKTLPGLRTAQKYAVLRGGAQNHRIGLFDQVLIKENHIAAAGSLSAAVAAGRRAAGDRKVEVEVETLAEFEEALHAAPDIILLDEFSLEDMRTAVDINRSRGRHVTLEASGSVTLENVRSVAQTGVDYISIGGITKHVLAVDLSMRLQFAPP
jgi:nicotinate-nucleotide pyrophosphorylase (carboxylating)